MKLNLNQPIIGLDGVIKEGDKDLTLKTVVVRALATPLDSDKSIGAEKVAARWALAIKLNMGGEVEVTPEQCAELKARVAEVFVLNVSGPAMVMLNG